MPPVEVSSRWGFGLDCYNVNIYLSRVTYFLAIYPGLNGYTLHVLGFLDLQTEIDMLHRLVDNARAEDINFYKKRNIQGQGTLQ